MRAIHVLPGLSGNGSPFWSKNWIGWSLLGAGTAVFGLWVGAWVQVEQFQDDQLLTDYLSYVPVGVDACEYARTDPMGSEVRGLCDEAQTWANVWNATLPIWIVLWGVTAGFLIWYGVDQDPDDDASASTGPRLAWSPYLSPGGGGLGLHAWF